MSGNFFARAPAVVAARLLSEWLDLPSLGRLEMAMCSSEGRVHLMETFQGVVIKFAALKYHVPASRLSNWLANRQIRVASLEVGIEVILGVLPSILALIRNSSSNLVCVSVFRNSVLLPAINSAVADHCVNLTEKLLTECQVDESIRSVFLSSRQLRSIQLRSCSKLEPVFFYGVTCVKVTFIHVSGFISVPTLAMLLKMCPNLEHFARSEGLIQLSTYAQRLRTLQCFRCSFALGNIHCSIVHFLVLVECDLSDAELSRILDHCPFVEALNVSRNPALTNTSVAKILRVYNQQLRGIKVRECMHVTNAEIPNLCAACFRIEVLDLSFTSVSAMVVFRAVNLLVSLKVLCVNGLRLSDQFLECIAKSAIQRLEMNDTTGYSHEGIGKIILQSAHLRVISINSAYITPLVRLMWNTICASVKIVPPIDILDVY